jgi:hypothetical protein
MPDRCHCFCWGIHDLQGNKTRESVGTVVQFRFNIDQSLSHGERRLAGRKDEAMWREVQVVLGYLPEEAVGCPIVAFVRPALLYIVN